MTRAKSELIDHLKGEIERLRDEVATKDKMLYEYNDKFIRAVIEINSAFAKAVGEMGPQYNVQPTQTMSDPSRFTVYHGDDNGDLLKPVDMDNQERRQEHHDRDVDKEEGDA